MTHDFGQALLQPHSGSITEGVYFEVTGNETKNQLNKKRDLVNV